MTLHEQLSSLGLKGNEIRVYLALLKIGESLVGDVEKETGLHKQIIYNSIESLQKKGLVTVFESNGRKHFVVDDPGSIEDRAEKQFKQAQSIVPELMKIASTKRKVNELKIWKDKRGVRQYYIEALKKQPENSKVHILGVNSERFFEIFPKDGPHYSQVENLRKEKKITWDILLFSPKEDEVKQNEGRRLVEMRVINEQVQSPLDMMIWRDRVGLLIYGEEPYVIDVSGSEAVEGFKEYFNVLWRKGS